MRVLVTGGAGYIGAHIAPLLTDAVILDNRRALPGYRSILADVRGPLDLKGFDAVIHLAALKNAPESLSVPIDYYDHNVAGTINLVKHMKAAGVQRIVFSSSAAVYGERTNAKESDPLDPATPYARTKAACEAVIRDSGLSFAILRYFNPAGAYYGLCGGLFGALQTGHITITGTDYPTPDGTCIRDFVHISDLAEAHIRALHWDRVIVNIGTGRGTSVRQAIDAYRKQWPLTVACGTRRQGDAAASYANTDYAKSLGWTARRSLAQMVAASPRSASASQPQASP